MSAIGPLVVVRAGIDLRDEAKGGGAGTFARYLHGVERIAASLHADEPVLWKDGKAVLTFASGPVEERVPRAWRAAVELWQRCHLDLDLPVRIVALLRGPEASVFGSGDWLVDVDGLLDRTPARAVAVSEDIVLCSRPGDRESLAPGHFEVAGLRYHVFPADAHEGAPREEISDLDLWSELEELGRAPEVRELRYVGFRLPRRAPPVLDLASVFVSPALAPVRSDDPDALAAADRSRLFPGSDLRKWLGRFRHLVLLGEPGAGKTTLLRWLSLAVAEGSWPSLTGELLPRLPLLLGAGRLAEIPSLAEPGAEHALSQYWGSPAPELSTRVDTFLRRQLELGRCVVLVDGLDEVRIEDRPRVERWLSGLAARHARSVIVATSRVVGYSGFRPSESAGVALVSPFGAAARKSFVRAFCRAYLAWETGEDRPHEAEIQANGFLEAIAANERLRSLSRNPFMLSALALIHRAEGRLPRHRVQAYEMFVRALCETWSEARKLVPAATTAEPDPALSYEEQAIPVLGALALDMHERHPRGVAPTDFVRDRIAAALRAREDIDEAASLTAADAFLRRAGEEVQILLERGAGQWGFLHLCFQELFVAAGLHAAERFEEVALSHLLEPRWEEVVRLGVGYLALVQKRPVAAQRFIERALSHRAPEPWSRAASILGKHVAVAALLAVEAGDSLPVRSQRAIAERFAEWYCGAALHEPMLAHMSTESHFEARRWLEQLALSELAPRIADAFVERLSSGPATRRHVAARALRQMKVRVDPKALVAAAAAGESSPSSLAELLNLSASAEEMRALMEHPDERVRTMVVAAQETRPREQRAEILALAARDPAESVREAAAGAMEGTGRIDADWRAPETPSPDEVRRLVALLDDPSAQVRRRAFSRLTGAPTDSVVAAARRLATSDPDHEIRRHAVAFLAREGGELAALAGDPEPLVRKEALAAMDVLEASTLETAARATTDADLEVRRQAYRILEQGRTATAIDALARGLEDEEDPGARAICLGVLPFLPPDRRLHHIEAAMQDPSEVVRRAAARHVSSFPDRFELFARRLLADPSAQVRLEMVTVIANRHAPFPADALAPLLGSSDPGVSNMAALALAEQGDDAMGPLVDHETLPAARAALWRWAERRGWSFPAPADNPGDGGASLQT